MEITMLFWAILILLPIGGFMTIIHMIHSEIEASEEFKQKFGQNFLTSNNPFTSTPVEEKEKLDQIFH